MQHNNTAKFAFLYLLSLVGLGFLAVSVGVVAFQVINKYLVDIAQSYGMSYDSYSLRFAISAIIVSAPIYFVSVWQINKSLTKGVLDKDAAVRRWLTYFILFVSSVVMLGDLIAVINNFLSGELTLKFALKVLTILVIAGAVFGYYLYDIKRENVKGAIDLTIRVYFYCALIVTAVALIAGFVFVESPVQVRKQRQDTEVLNRVQTVRTGLVNYYEDTKALPEALNELLNGTRFIVSERDLVNPVTNEAFGYRVVSNTEYEICTTFQTSNKNKQEDYRYGYYNDFWQHDAGEQCVTWSVTSLKEPGVMPVR